jgi:hypothetical protein
MKNIKTLEKKLDVKDVKCADCMYYYKYSTPMKGFCTRMHRHSSEARNICTKTQWYSEMCILNAAMDAQFK